MANNNDKKVLNVPALRFPEFKGEWKKMRLGDNCNIQMCKRIMAAQTNTEGGVPFYKIGTIGGKADAYISKDLFDVSDCSTTSCVFDFLLRCTPL